MLTAMLLLACLAQEPELRYVANAGMLIDVDRRAFLVDAPIRDGISPYATSPAAERNRLEMALPPYRPRGRDPHHALARGPFQRGGCGGTSGAQPARGVGFVAGGRGSGAPRRTGPGPVRVCSRYCRRQVDSEAVRVAGVPIHVLRIRHNPTRRLPEQHVGFLIGDSAPVLHVGDADPTAGNFVRLRALPAVDVALLPFW